MSLQTKHDNRLVRLHERLQRAQAVTPKLLSDLAGSCMRGAALNRTDARTRIDRLVASEAWTDAALALVELDLPQWKLRRLVYDDGEWHCCLSRQPDLPAWLDETVEVRHEVLPLAILSAFVDARDIVTSVHDVSETVPRIAPDRCQPVCCDNFA